VNRAIWFVEDSWQALVGLRPSPATSIRFGVSMRKLPRPDFADAALAPQAVAAGDIRLAGLCAMTDANDHDQVFVNSYPSEGAHSGPAVLADLELR
jgi:hypothetical protein